MKAFSLLAAAGGVLALALMNFSDPARSGPLEDLVNSKFPPVTADQQRQRAITSAIKTLSTTPQFEVAASLSLADLQAIAAANKEIQGYGVTSLKLSGSQEIIDAVVTFDRDVDGQVVPASQPRLKALFDRVHPHFTGIISFGATLISIFPSHTKEGLAVSFRIRPVFRNIKVANMSVGSGTFDELLGQNAVDLTDAAEVIADWLNSYANNISGALTRMEIANIKVPNTPFPPQDIKKSIQITSSDGTNIALELNGNPFNMQIYLHYFAWFVDQDRIRILAYFSTDMFESAPQARPDAGTNYTFANLASMFDKSLSSNLGITNPSSGAWVAMSKSLIAGFLTSTFNSSNPCLSASGDIPRQRFAKKVSLPQAKSIDCTPTDRCDQPYDRRNCHGLGKPACEIAKAVQNKIYAINKGKCEAAKSTKKGLCETAKGGVDLIAHTGNFANIDGSFGEGTASMKTCFQRVVFSPALDKVDLFLTVGGQGSANTYLKFTPLDIVGHLTCQAPWTENKRVSVTIPDQPLNLSAIVKYGDEPGSLIFSTIIRTSALAAQINPSPRNLILSSYNMDIACAPIAPLVNVFTIGAAPFIPELQGSVQFPGQEMSLDYQMSPFQFEVMGVPLSVQFSDNPLAFIATGNLKLVPPH